MEEEIVKCLDSLLSQHPAQRVEAEEKFAILKQQLGFALGLAKIVIHSQLSVYHRQLASIILKTFIETHWMNTSDEALQKDRIAQINKEKFEYSQDYDYEEEEEEEEEIEPNNEPQGPIIIIDEREKVELRNIIPNGLSIEERSIQGNISVCLGVIAKYDYPTLFPNLLSSLKEIIMTNSSATTKYGALLSLEIIIHPDILPNEILEIEFQSLNPFLLEVYSTSVYQVKKSCASILLSLVNWILNRRVEKEEKLSETATNINDRSKGMLPKLLQTIPNWFSVMSKDLASLDSLGPVEIAVKILILQIVCLFIYSLPKTIEAYSNFLSISWDILFKYQNYYYEGLVVTDKLHGSSLIDFNCGESYSFDNVLLMVLEIFHAWLSKPNLKAVVYPIVGDLVYTLVYYQQITFNQLENYIADSNEFVIDENEELYSTHSLSIRSSANRLIIELIRHHSSAKNAQYLPTILESIKKRIIETENARESHQSTNEWWKMREAALLTLGNSVGPLGRALSNEKNPKKRGKKGEEKAPFCFPVEYFTTLQQDASHENSFLRYRSLYCASQCAQFIPEYQLILPFFEATTKCLNPSINDTFLKIGAVKSLKSYLSIIKPENYLQHLENILTGICYLSLNAESDTLYLLLDLLIKVLKTASKNPMSITPFINMLVDTTLLLWKKLAEDAFSNSYILDITELLITGGYLENFTVVISKLVPVISTIFSSPEMLIEKVTSITLLSNIFRCFGDVINNNKNNNNQDLLIQLSNATIPALFQVLFQYTEDGLLDAGIRCLKWYLVAVIQATNHKCTEFLSQLTIGNSSSLQLIIQFIGKLLHPSVSDITATHIGGLINLLLSSSLPVLVQQNLLSQLIQAILERLSTAKLPDFQTGLVVVICRLFLLDSNYMIDLLEKLSIIGGISALQFFLRTWSKTVTNFVSEYQNVITLSTLSHLILLGDGRVLNVTVPGSIINKPKRSGLRSAAKSKNTEEVWSEVPFIVKAYSILTDEMIASVDDENAKEYDEYGFDEEDEFDEDDYDVGEEDFDELNDEDEWDADRFDDDELDGYNLLSDMLDGNPDEGEEEEVPIPDDPLTKGLNPRGVLVSFFTNFKNKDSKTFESLFQSSPRQTQKVIIENVFSSKKKSGKK